MAGLCQACPDVTTEMTVNTEAESTHNVVDLKFGVRFDNRRYHERRCAYRRDIRSDVLLCKWTASTYHVSALVILAMYGDCVLLVPDPQS